jgi:hypothetical protein
MGSGLGFGRRRFASGGLCLALQSIFKANPDALTAL